MDTKSILPGFTAESSLSKSNQHYSGAVIGAAATNQVVPQFFPVGLCKKALYYCNRGYENWCDILEKFCLGSQG